MRRRLRSVLGACLLLVACQGRAPLDHFERVFLVTFDTLRADHLGSYGYPRPTSPFLDQLAAQGVRFQHAFSHMPTTAPAHASLLTALYPFEHDVRKNGEQLDASFLSVGDLLGQAGFETAAFVGVRFLQRCLRHDFDHFDVAVTEGRNYRVASETIDATLDWLGEKTPQDRLFVWIHLFDPHEHWENTPAPPEYLELMALRTPQEQETLFAFLRDFHDLRPRQLQPGRSAVQRILRYDAQIRFADRELERLYRAVAEQGLARDSLWIVTSDHGEGLGNHGYVLHGRYLYGEHLRVPLIFHAPRQGFPRRTTAALAQHVDLLPTLADLMGLPAEPAGYRLRGRSLRPFLEGAEDGSPVYVFAQRRPKEKDRPSFEDGDLYSLQDSRFKYIHRSVGQSEFYDLAEDPLEKRNRIGIDSPDRDRLRRVLEAEFTPRFHDPVIPQAREALDDATLEELRALGYVE